MRRTIVLLAVIGAALVAISGLFGCGGGTPGPAVTVTVTRTSAASQTPTVPADAIATVGSGVVTQAQFDLIIRQARAQST